MERFFTSMTHASFPSSPLPYSLPLIYRPLSVNFWPLINLGSAERSGHSPMQSYVSISLVWALNNPTSINSWKMFCHLG